MLVGFAIVGSTVIAYETPEGATIAFSNLYAASLSDATRTVTRMSPPAVGDEAIAFHFVYSGEASTNMDAYAVLFRRGNILSYVLAISATSTGNFIEVSYWAALIDGRIMGKPVVVPGGTSF
jgi:hypothetical protein